MKPGVYIRTTANIIITEEDIDKYQYTKDDIYGIIIISEHCNTFEIIIDDLDENKKITRAEFDENSFGAIDHCIQILQNCIDGYVARDKNGDLYFHYIKPHRENEFELTWWGSTDANFWISDDDFPEFKDLKWEDEPLEVKIVIKKV